LAALDKPGRTLAGSPSLGLIEGLRVTSRDIRPGGKRAYHELEFALDSRAVQPKVTEKREKTFPSREGWELVTRRDYRSMSKEREDKPNQERKDPGSCRQEGERSLKVKKRLGSTTSGSNEGRTEAVIEGLADGIVSIYKGG